MKLTKEKDFVKNLKFLMADAKIGSWNINKIILEIEKLIEYTNKS